MIKTSKFGPYDLYTLSNGNLEFSVTTIGAAWISLKYKGKEMITPYLTASAVTEKGYLCKGIGRYANRIGGASFTLEGKEYLLPANEGKNMLHGGADSYDKRDWKAEVITADENGKACEKLKLSIFSPDGDNGFPGNLTMTLQFSLKDSVLHIDFFGETDTVTVFSPTVHPYFNLGRQGSVLDAELKFCASGHVEVDDELIPTGKILDCDGKYDFCDSRKIETDLDDAFVCPEDYCCTLKMNGFAMDVRTDMPAIQICTGARMIAPYFPHDAVAIEPEFYPDSPNHSDFPSTVLKQGDHFHKYVEYEFTEI